MSNERGVVLTDETKPRIVLTDETQPRTDPQKVAEALGAELVKRQQIRSLRTPFPNWPWDWPE